MILNDQWLSPTPLTGAHVGYRHDNVGIYCVKVVAKPFYFYLDVKLEKSSMKMLALTVLCSTVSFLIIANAYAEKKEFKPTLIYLLNSNMSLSVIYLQAFIMLWYFCQVLKTIFFGTLRAAEVEVIFISILINKIINNCFP